MAIYEESVASTMYFVGTPTIYAEPSTPYYGNVGNATTYMKRKLNPQSWFDAEYDQQVAALSEATRIIDALPFKGTKVATDQRLHFPTTEKGTPNDVLTATYEIALMLLDGWEPDREVNKLMSGSEGYSGFRKTYNRDTVQEHVRAGIPSAYAWSILRPYLCDPKAIKLI